MAGRGLRAVHARYRRAGHGGGADAAILLNLYGAATRCPAFALINGSGRSGLNLAIAIIDGVISRIGLAALLGFALHMDCFGFWMGDALAGFMPFIIGGVFYLSGRWKESAVQGG